MIRELSRAVVLLAAMGTAVNAGTINSALEAHLQSTQSDTVRVVVHLKDVPQFNVDGLTRGTQPDREATLRAFQQNAQAAQAAFLQEVGGLVAARSTVKTFWVANAVALTVSPDQVAKIAARSDVREVQLNETIQLEVPHAAEIPKREKEILAGRAPEADTAQFTYGLIKVGVPELRQVYGLNGEGVTVGILDTGFDAEHPDLKGKLLLWKDFTEDPKPTPYDDHGHGTHCAGTIGGSDTSGMSIGVAPKVKFVAAKVFTGSGGATTEGLLGAMEWVVDPDGNPSTNDMPAVCSNSWGGGPGRTVFLEATKKWVALGMFPNFAAGNSGPGAGSVGTPGGFVEAFAVGATDEDDAIASFSSRGPATWDGVQTTKPEVSAPGVDVTSAKPGGGYQAMSGTSMATPHVSGILALMYQANPGMTIAQARDLLESTSVDLGDSGRDNSFGAGRTNALAAAQIIVSGGKIKGKLTDAETGAGMGGTISLAENGLSVKTDKTTGEFTIIVPAGTYTLSAKSFGFTEEAGVTVEVAAQQTQEVNVSLTRAASGVLAGKVVSSTSGESLAAKITVLDTPLDPVATQATGEFSVTLPAGNYKLLVTAYAHDPLNTEAYEVTADQTSEIEVSLAHVPAILVLADDDKKNYDKQYTETLTAMGHAFSRVTSEALGSQLSGEFLAQYQTVVWMTGDSYSNTLTETDQAALKSFVASGGRLFLSGQDIGYECKNTDFYKNVLKAKFTADSSDSKEVSGRGLAFKIEGGNGANNQRYPDRIEANGSEAFLSYGGSQGAAALAGTHGSGKFVYFAFGFEGIDTAENRKATLANVLEYLAATPAEQAARATKLSHEIPAARDAQRIEKMEQLND